jgi:molybdopterin/thiamine biosynthesis adenylyltransferase
LIEQIDGEHTLQEIAEIMKAEEDVSNDEVVNLIASLERMKIIVQKNNSQSIISSYDFTRFSRQVNYFQEFFTSEEEGIFGQKKLFDTKMLIFGCGAVGSDIAILLAMAGVRSFVLYDCDTVTQSDISRHMFYQKQYEGMNKTEALAQTLASIDSSVLSKCVNEFMQPHTDIDELISECHFVVNTLDEPYIGYTAAKVSRACMKASRPHYIAGGFDAHLASTGELIIPYVTPCVECYAGHFKESLKNWKPRPHPVKVRADEIGGLSSMSLFSSSFAVIEIIKYLVGLCDVESNFKIRGEFLFDDMSLTYLNVKKNENCDICGGSNEK